jgi:tight adherence protein B
VTVVAALTVGLACALAAGALTGALPKPRPRRPSPRTEQRRMWLQQAGVAVTPAQFAAGSVAAGCVMLVAVAALTGSTFVGLVPALAVTAVPRVYFGRRRRLRLAQVQHAWPDGLRDLLASISAGRSLTQSVVALAEHGPPALRDAFAGYPSLARSLGTVAALEIVKEELADPTSTNIYPHGGEATGRRVRPNQLGQGRHAARCRAATEGRPAHLPRAWLDARRVRRQRHHRR